MSRNKFVLGFMTLAILYLLLPSSGTYGLVKAYMLAILPYLVIFIIIWLIISINILRRAMQKLSANINDENTLKVAKLLGITFDVKRFMGDTNLVNLYKQVNFSKNVSLYSKEVLYRAMLRKRLNVPPPSGGKTKKKKK